MKENGLHSTWTFLGGIKLFFIKCIIATISLPFIKKFEQYDEFCEEDPLKFNASQALYLAHKYYVKKRKVKSWDYNQSAPHWLMDYFNSDNQKVVKISVAGDILPYAKLMEFSYEKIWENCSYFRKSDIKIANLESPLSLNHPTRWVPEVATWNMHLNGNLEYWNLITNDDKIKFSGLTLANNHMLDMGLDGLNNTVDFLKQRDITPIGYGNNKPYSIIEKNGFKLGLIAFTFSLNLEKLVDKNIPLQEFHTPDFDWNSILSVVNDLRKQKVDAIFILPHGNHAYVDHPQKYARENLIQLAKLSQVEAILVCHAHQANGFEWIHHQGQKATLIAHSLGDFIGYDIWSDSRWFQIWNFKFVLEHKKWIWKSAYYTKHHRN